MPELTLAAGVASPVPNVSAGGTYLFTNITKRPGLGSDVHINATGSTNPADDIKIVAAGGSDLVRSISGALYAWSSNGGPLRYEQTGAAFPSPTASIYPYASRRALSRVKAKQGNMRVLYVGTSEGRGRGAPTPGSFVGSSAYAITRLLRDRLNGAGIPAQDDNILGVANLQMKYDQYDPRVVFGAGWKDATAGQNGFGGDLVPNSTGGPGTLNPVVLSFGTVADTLEMIVATGNATGAGSGFGTATVAYNDGQGGAYTNVGTVDSGGAAYGFRKYSFAVPKGVHSFRITPASTSDLIYFHTARTFDSTASRVIIENAAVSGAKSNDLNYGSWNFAAWLAASAVSYDLIVVEYEKNDELQNVLPADFSTNLGATLDLARGNGADVILLGDPQSQTPSMYPYLAYHDVQAQYAATKGFPFVDMGLRLGTYAVANAAGKMSDANHWSAAGYSDVADALYSAIVG